MTNFTSTYSSTDPPCHGIACPYGSCIYWECLAEADYQHYPSGQHHLVVTVTFPGAVLFGAYSHPSGVTLYDGSTAATTHTFTVDAPVTDDFWQGYWHGGDPFITISYSITYSSSSGEVSTLCEFGTRIKAGVPSIVALTPAFLVQLGGAFSRGFRTTLATFFAGRVVDNLDLCGQLPPAVPTIEPIDIVNLTTYIAFGAHQDAFDKFWTWILAMVWPTFCECVPGTPPPVEPPPLDTTAPPNLPVFGPAPCDNSDICALLMQTWEDVEGLYGMLAMMRQELQALQSQSVPWSYVPGTLHSGLTGQGEFAVSGILGLSVEFTTVPSHLSRREDDPLTTYGLGEIGLGTDDGWQQSRKCSHNPQLILPIGPEVTRVAYTFAGGAVANILELVRRT